MSHPKRKDKFVAWSKAMVEGATVDRPVYPGTREKMDHRAFKQRRRRRRRKHSAKKET